MENEQRKPTRREALAALGIGAALAYAAPTVTRIDQAKAAAPSHSCPPGAPGCGGGPPGRPGGPPPGRP